MLRFHSCFFSSVVVTNCWALALHAIVTITYCLNRVVLAARPRMLSGRVGDALPAHKKTPRCATQHANVHAMRHKVTVSAAARAACSSLPLIGLTCAALVVVWGENEGHGSLYGVDRSGEVVRHGPATQPNSHAFLLR